MTGLSADLQLKEIYKNENAQLRSFADKSDTNERPFRKSDAGLSYRQQS